MSKIKFRLFIDHAVGSCMYQWFGCHLPSAGFHRVFPTKRRDCDCPGFPPPLGSRRLRSRNCLHLTSIPLSFNKPASGRKYQIIFIATRRRLLVIDGKGRCIFNVIMQNYSWKANVDPRTDDYALKKEKDRSKRQAPVTRSVHARIQKIFRQGGGSTPYIPPTGLVKSQARRWEVFLRK